MMKRALGQNKILVFIFFTFERDTTNYRGTLVENVKNQPTLLSTVQCGEGGGGRNILVAAVRKSF
jgi:hypothetical protein